MSPQMLIAQTSTESYYHVGGFWAMVMGVCTLAGMVAMMWGAARRKWQRHDDDVRARIISEQLKVSQQKTFDQQHMDVEELKKGLKEGKDATHEASKRIEEGLNAISNEARQMSADFLAHCTDDQDRFDKFKKQLDSQDAMLKETQKDVKAIRASITKGR